MVNMSLYAILSIYAYKLIKDNKIKWSSIISMSILIAIIGFTRIYLGVHYAGDILGGWLLGFAVSIVIYAITKKSIINEK